MTDVFEYIRNQIVIGKDPDIIVDKVIERFKVEIAFYKLPPDMKDEMVKQLVNMAYFMYNNKLKGD